jgi:hypothetical protein
MSFPVLSNKDCFRVLLQHMAGPLKKNTALRENVGAALDAHAAEIMGTPLATRVPVSESPSPPLLLLCDDEIFVHETLKSTVTLLSDWAGLIPMTEEPPALHALGKDHLCTLRFPLSPCLPMALGSMYDRHCFETLLEGLLSGLAHLSQNTLSKTRHVHRNGEDPITWSMPCPSASFFQGTHQMLTEAVAIFRKQHAYADRFSYVLSSASGRLFVRTEFQPDEHDVLTRVFQSAGHVCVLLSHAQEVTPAHCAGLLDFLRTSRYAPTVVVTAQPSETWPPPDVVSRVKCVQVASR